jgi:hypothetical protein
LHKTDIVSIFYSKPKRSNMKKWIIGSLVGAILVFAWQFLSWSLLGIHGGEEKYTASQDQILSALNSSGLAEGQYRLPNAPPGATMDEQQNLMKQNEGKPWARVLYTKSASASMTSPMIMGFVVDLVLVILLISILVRGGLPSFTGIFTGAIAVGLFTFLWGPYTEHNWFNVPWSVIQGHLIDAVVAWGLCGLWLGWWLRKPSN